MDGDARERRAKPADRVQRNKTDSIAWAKKRREQAEAAERKRAERKRAEEAAKKAHEEYEEQLEQYKQRGFAPAGAFPTNGAAAAEEPASWDDTPIGSAIPPPRQRQRQPAAAPPRQPGGGGEPKPGPKPGGEDGPFGRSWNDGFADTTSGGWAMMGDNLLDEEPPPPRESPAPRGRGRGRGRAGGRAAAGGRGRGEKRQPRSSVKEVRQRRDEQKQEEQRQHEEALTQARIQAAAERRLAADRGRMRSAAAPEEPPVPAPAPAPAPTPAPAPAVRRSGGTPLSPKQRGPTPTEAALDAALAHADPNAMGWEDFQRMLDQPDEAIAERCARTPPTVDAVEAGGLVGVDPDRPVRAKPKLSSQQPKARRAQAVAASEPVEQEEMPEPPPHMLAGDPRAPVSPAASPRRRGGKARERGGERGGGAPSRTPPRGRQKARVSSIGPGKAAKAAMAIEQKRQERRAAAGRERARREAEVAEHGDQPNLLFRRLIKEFRTEIAEGRRTLSGAGAAGGSVAGRGRLLVAVRKRPLLDHREGDEYDVLTTVGPSALIAHEPRTKMDMTQTMEHHQFLFDRVFDEHASTADVYHEAVAPSLHATLESQLSGDRGNLTVFAYGQTGSGKTFTMEPIYAQTVQEALHACAQYRGVQLSISFFEIYCAKVFDLLRGRAEVRTLEDARGEIQVENLAEEPVSAFETAMGTIERGQRARVTHANAVHADSSRSHAVLQLLLRSSDEEEVPCPSLSA